MIDLLRNRRSARDVESRAVEEEKVELLKEAALRSPSSRSFNPGEFIFVDHEETLRDLARCKEHGAGFLSRAPLAVVVLGDTGRSDTCIEDCSIAAITLQYAAESLGLSSCWCQVRLRAQPGSGLAEDYVRELLGVPQHYLVECVVGIGYPAKDKPGHPRKDLDWDKVRVDRF